MSQAAISHILARNSDFEKMQERDLTAKRPRTVISEKLDVALAEWVLQCQARRIAISMDLIQAKGREFAVKLNLGDQPKFSSGWLPSFMERHGFKGQSPTVKVVLLIQQQLQPIFPRSEKIISEYQPKMSTT